MLIFSSLLDSPTPSRLETSPCVGEGFSNVASTSHGIRIVGGVRALSGRAAVAVAAAGFYFEERADVPFFSTGSIHGILRTAHCVREVEGLFLE